MKKIVFTLSMMFLAITSYSQEFTYKRVFIEIPGMGSNFVKIQGSISVSDSLITLKGYGQEQTLNVIKNSSAPNTQQFKSKINEDTDVRISLVPNPIPNKNEDYLMVMETRDNFTNSISRTSYYLTLIK